MKKAKGSVLISLFEEGLDLEGDGHECLFLRRAMDTWKGSRVVYQRDCGYMEAEDEDYHRIHMQTWSVETKEKLGFERQRQGKIRFGDIAKYHDLVMRYCSMITALRGHRSIA